MPFLMRIPDDSCHRIWYRNRVLVEVADWLYGNHRLDARHCPVEADPDYHVLADVPVHPMGERFANSHAVGPLYLETRYDSPTTLECAARIFSYACRIIERAGTDDGR